ncbi:MAG: NAD(+)/NADH kinase [Deltaproteobacteria bacterium]|nr:NAD(+)/NADH kinase [Deltaproteobacteria bacterium]
MKLNRVLVVYKQVGKAAAARRGTDRVGMGAHLRTLDALYDILKALGVHFTAIPLSQLKTVDDVPLVITVGGDGTVLATSHFVRRQPILGVKSFGQQSVGFFCAATRESLGIYMRGLVHGLRRPRRLNRLEVVMNGQRLRELILNDALFAHASPAAISDYRFAVGRRTEIQRSSGVWVSTAAGSTAALAAGGGHPLPLDSARVAYLVREPYAPERPYRVIRGVVGPRTRIAIESLIPQGTLSIDGAGIQYPAPEGTRIVIRQARQPLWIYWR